jgi:hypothetical protein
MISNIYVFTPTGKIKRPSYLTVATCVKESWDKVDEDLIKRSFKSCGISTNTDGSEDDCLFDDNLLDHTDDKVVENSNNLIDEYSEETDYENKWDIEVDQKEINDESESEADGNYGYKDSDDENEEIQHRLKELKKIYKVKNFFLCLYCFILIYC